jgi:predicted tellurium resistance membrane protein TerC
MEWIMSIDIWASLATLTALEIVLGIDNLLFISIVAGRMPKEKQAIVRTTGLALALLMRVALLAAISWIVGLTRPLFTVADFTASWRDIILLGGGLFLLTKGTLEIHHSVEGADAGANGGAVGGMAKAIAQIIVLDLVFSLDSIITAVGMTDRLPVMVAAVVIAMAVMLFAAGPVSRFVEAHPTTKMLALSFLILIGVALVADGLHFHIPRGYLYFAIAFSVGVEGLNLLAARRRKRRRAVSK